MYVYANSVNTHYSFVLGQWKLKDNILVCTCDYPNLDVKPCYIIYMLILLTFVFHFNSYYNRCNRYPYLTLY